MTSPAGTGTSLTFPDLEVHTLVDDVGSYISPADFFAGFDEDDQRAIEAIPAAYDASAGRLRLSYHSYLIRTPTMNVLVDTAVGRGKTIPVRPQWNERIDDSWLRQLAAAGLQPEDIDVVVFSHLHLDHVGWNTVHGDTGWTPTFGRATYLFVKTEYEHVSCQSDTDASAASSPVADAVRHSYLESIEPVMRAGQGQLVADDYRLDDVVRLVAAPGHTQGHCIIEIGGPEPVAVITGDLFHSPVQVQAPRLASYSDTDPDAAIRSREAFLTRYADSGVVVCGSHFPGKAHGHVVRGADRYEYV